MSRNKGQMLVEIVVALGVIVVVLLGVVDLVSRSSKTVRVQKNKERAVKIIEAEFSRIRWEKESDPDGYFASHTQMSVSPCLVSNDEIAKDYTCEDRIVPITILQPGDGLSITVTVSWSEPGSGLLNVTMTQQFGKQ